MISTEGMAVFLVLGLAVILCRSIYDKVSSMKLVDMIATRLAGSDPAMSTMKNMDLKFACLVFCV
jgi:hypothetical protein